jgi:hypothetical protein
MPEQLGQRPASSLGAGAVELETTLTLGGPTGDFVTFYILSM